MRARAEIHRSLFNAGIVILALAAPAIGVAKQRHCAPAISDPAALAAATSIAIRPFEFACASPYPDTVNAKWSVEMPKLIGLELIERGYNDVTIIGRDEAASADIVIEGSFTDLDKGSGAGRILVGSGGTEASMSASVTLNSGVTGDTVATFSCRRSGAGGPLGAGGWLAGSSKVIMHNHMERFAKSVARVVAGQADNDVDGR